MALDLSALDGLAIGPPDGPMRVAPTAPISAFVEDPTQPRIEFEEDGEYLALVEDIRRRGILQPVIVRRLPSGVLQVRFGARRLRAASAAGLTRIPYIETDDERQFDDYAQVAENRYQRPLQPLELALFIERKLAGGEKKKQVAANLQLDPSAVTHLLALAFDPPVWLLELYHSRRCRAPHLLYALRRLSRGNGTALEAALSDGLPVDHLRVKSISAILGHAEKPRAGKGDSSDPTSRAPAQAGADGGDASTRCIAPFVGETSRRSGVVRNTSRANGRNPSPPLLEEVRLLGLRRGAELELLLVRAPQSHGLIWVRYLADGRIAEVAMDEIVLTCLERASVAADERDVVVAAPTARNIPEAGGGRSVFSAVDIGGESPDGEN